MTRGVRANPSAVPPAGYLSPAARQALVFMLRWPLRRQMDLRYVTADGARLFQPGTIAVLTRRGLAVTLADAARITESGRRSLQLYQPQANPQPRRLPNLPPRSLRMTTIATPATTPGSPPTLTDAAQQCSNCAGAEGTRHTLLCLDPHSDHRDERVSPFSWCKRWSAKP